MAINIKNERVLTLARRAAELTGKSQVSAIEEALERLLREYDDKQRVDLAWQRELKIARVKVVLDEIDAAPINPDAEIQSQDDLYDPETGLPR